jgi:hypothetical protein
MTSSPLGYLSDRAPLSESIAAANKKITMIYLLTNHVQPCQDRAKSRELADRQER